MLSSNDWGSSLGGQQLICSTQGHPLPPPLCLVMGEISPPLPRICHYALPQTKQEKKNLSSHLNIAPKH